MHKRFILQFLLLLGLMTQGCDRAPGTDEASNNTLPDRGTQGFIGDQACYAALAALDFADLMAAAVKDSPRLRGAGSDYVPDTVHLKVGLTDPDLTPVEREMVLGLHYLSCFGEAQIDLKAGKGIPGPVSDTPTYGRVLGITSDTAVMCELFSSANGRMPHDGIELALYSQAALLNSPEALDEFLQWPREKQFTLILPYLNPVSGEFYGDFSDSRWSPGALYMRRATSTELKQRDDVGQRIFKEQGEIAPAAWVFVHFGERQDVVISDWLTYSARSNSSYFKHPDLTLPDVQGGNPSHPVNPCTASNPCTP